MFPEPQILQYVAGTEERGLLPAAFGFELPTGDTFGAVPQLYWSMVASHDVLMDYKYIL